MPADFSQIHLLPVEASALRRYARKRRIPLDAPHVDALRAYGFLRLDSDPLDSPRRRKAAWYAVTPDGLRYLYYLDGQRRDRRWTRGLAIAAIIISIAALCVSVLSLWLQWKSL